MGEGGGGGGWTDDHIYIFEQIKPGAGNARLLEMRLGYIRQTIGQSAINIVHHIGAEAVAIIPHAGPMRGHKINTPQHFETVVAIGEIRTGIDCRGKMMLEQAGAFSKNGPVGM